MKRIRWIASEGRGRPVVGSIVSIVRILRKVRGVDVYSYLFLQAHDCVGVKMEVDKVSFVRSPINVLECQHALSGSSSSCDSLSLAIVRVCGAAQGRG